MNLATQQPKAILSEKNLISMSSRKERDRINYYQQLTLRFLPFNVRISRLMRELERESENRLQQLMQMSQSSGAQAVSWVKPYSSLNRDEHKHQHFFVIDSHMAVKMLEQAWQYEYETKGFYENLRVRNTLLSLDKILESFGKQAKQQARIVQECKDQAFLLGQWRRDQGMLRRIV